MTNIPNIFMAPVWLIAIKVVGTCAVYFGLRMLILKILKRSSPKYYNKLQGIIDVLLAIPFAFSILDILEVKAFGLITSLGITGLASGVISGFVFKDIIKNYISGITLQVYQNFNIGDTIEISGISGEVTSIGVRHVVVKSKSKTYFVPSSKVFSDTFCIHSKTK